MKVAAAEQVSTEFQHQKQRALKQVAAFSQKQALQHTLQHTLPNTATHTATHTAAHQHQKQKVLKQVTEF